MKKIIAAILSIMFIVALLVICFGIGEKTSFFVSFNAMIDPLVEISDYGISLLNRFTSTRFDVDQNVKIYRTYFGDIYCDTIKGQGLFYGESFCYSNDPDIDSYSRHPITRSYRFYDKEGNLKYKQGMFEFTTVYIYTSYDTYLSEYQRNPSSVGWSGVSADENGS